MRLILVFLIFPAYHMFIEVYEVFVDVIRTLHNTISRDESFIEIIAKIVEKTPMCLYIT